MERVRLDFDASEFEALSRLAERHLRPVPNEARHIVRVALQAAGLLRLRADTPPESAAQSDLCR
jgi:hypothetical protein